MSSSELQITIDQAWEERESISPDTTGAVRDAIETALDGLGEGIPTREALHTSAAAPSTWSSWYLATTRQAATACAAPPMMSAQII